MQKFPFGARVAGRFDGFHEFLDAALDVRERAALFRMRTAGQNIMRQLRRRVRQNVADDERLQFAEQFRIDAVLRHVLAENYQRLDLAGSKSHSAICDIFDADFA